MFIFDASSVTVMPGLSRTTLRACSARVTTLASRSEEHTSELQSRLHLVCRLLLEKKKQTRCSNSSPCYANLPPCNSPQCPLRCPLCCVKCRLPCTALFLTLTAPDFSQDLSTVDAR